MRSNFLYIALICIVTNTSFAQIDDAAFEKKMEMKTKAKDYPWAYKNMFLDYKLGAFNEFLVAKNIDYVYLEPSYTGDPTPDTITYHDGGVSMSILSFTLEPRVNLYSSKKTSVFLKSPLSFGVSVFMNQKYGFPNKGAGAFNLNLPMLIGFSKGLNSNYSSTSKNGFAMAAGFQYTLAPLVGGKTNIFEIRDLIPVGEGYVQRKTWFMPLVQLDYYKLSRKNKIRGYSMAICPYGTFYIKLAMNFVGSKK